MKIKWLLNLDSMFSNRLHAFPADEKEYGDWSLCGRGSGSKKVEGVAPKCAKCFEMLSKVPMSTIEKNRAKDRRYNNNKKGKQPMPKVEEVAPFGEKDIESMSYMRKHAASGQ
jgi:hypothetical protein